MKETSPFRQLAVSEYLRMFQDLLSPTAEVSWFEKVLIEGTYELVVLGHYEGDQLKAMENTSRVAYKILQEGASTSFDKRFGFKASRNSPPGMVRWFNDERAAHS